MAKKKKAPPAQPAGPSSAAPEAPAIVGIGASAGGLEAFTQLLRALPTDTGLAFVLVQHLEPKHESVLTALLARVTKLPVHEVREGMHVDPNHVYVIPANADLSVVDGLLHIVGRQAAAGRHLPIDYFLRALATSQGPRAIGVILSGTASDGTAGVRAIKQEGGITFAQDPESAKFDGMPRSAIATGCVDFILPPERIAKELARIGRHPFVGLMPLDAIPALPAHEEEWARLFRLLRSNTGVDFTFYKKSTVKRRIARRMTVNKVASLNAYLRILERNAAEVDALFEELLILVTEFFRDPEVFEALQKRVIAHILKSKPGDEPLRIWCAGCSSGQEAYSIAICLSESLGDKASARAVQIFGTDASENAIDKARVGIYSKDEVKDVSEERLRRFFKRVNGDYQVNEVLREMCVFARHDLIHDPPFSKLHLVSCRNVLIYFEPTLQKRVLGAFHYGLRNDGVLLLGKAESLGSHTDLFGATDRKLKFFRKNVTAHVPFNLAQPLYEHAPPGKPHRESSSGVDLEKEADRVVWERSACAALVVDDDLQILHFRGDTSPYLRPVPGKASLQLMRILREEIVLEVRSALQRARRGRTVRAERIEIQDDHQTRRVNVEVRPLAHGGPENSYLILFEPSLPAGAAQAAPAVRRGKAGKARQTPEETRLREELVRTREYVQAIIRDQETTNEELKTANEEALSSMEELQSTNEELETAKEELQSSNEELVTLNEQLQNRNSELAQLSSDLGSVLSGVDIPIVILDPERRIRRFTPPAEKLLGLIPGDVGRPISKIRLGVHIPDLDHLIAAVAETGQEAMREVQAESGLWLLLRIHAFRTGEDKVEGVLMAFVDIHELRAHQAALEKDKNFITAILDAAKDLLVVVLDREGRILHFNLACQQRTGYSLDEVRGHWLWDFLAAPEEVESAKAAFAEMAGGAPNQYEGGWLTKDGRRLLISWSNSVAKSDGTVEFVIATGIDVTERQEARHMAQQSEATVRAIMEGSAVAILACDTEGRIKLANPTAEKMFGYTRDRLLGGPLEMLLPKRLRDRHVEHRASWFAQPDDRPMGPGMELAGRRRDGTEFPIEVSLSHIGGGEGTLGVAFVSDITERQKSERVLIEYRDQLASEVSALGSLREAGDSLWRSHDLAAGLETMIDYGMALLGADMGDIQLLNPETHVLEIVAQRGFGPDFLEHFREVPAADDTACGRSLRAKKTIVIEDVETDAGFAPHRAAAAAARYRAVQSTPLPGKDGEAIGVFSTHFHQPHRPSEHELRRFELFARQSAEFVERLRSEEQLRRSQATVLALLETAAQAILAIDKEGRIRLANTTAEKMFGYSRDALLGQPLESLLAESLRARHAQHRADWFAEPQNRPMGLGWELAGLRQDGSEFPVEIHLSFIGSQESALGVAFISDITARKKDERTLLEYRNQLQNLTGALIAAKEATSRNVARELHDDYSQRMAALSNQLVTLEKRLPAKSGRRLRSHLDEFRAKLDALSDDLRRVAYRLHPAALEHLGLAAALEAHCAEFSKLYPIKVQFAHDRMPPSLRDEVALCFYRVAQEGLTNIARHSGAAEAEVHLEGNGRQIRLTISDNGKGFDPELPATHAGLGLISIRERMRLLGGTFSIDPGPGRGTRIQVELPLETEGC